jgi:hypothetical protein
MGYSLFFVDYGRVETKVELLLVSTNSEAHVRIPVRIKSLGASILRVRMEHFPNYFAGNMLLRGRYDALINILDAAYLLDPAAVALCEPRIFSCYQFEKVLCCTLCCTSRLDIVYVLV